MPQAYKFIVSMPVDTTLPRDRYTNTLHFEHVAGSLLNTDLEDMCANIGGVYQARYADAAKEIRVTAYDTDAVPNYPRGTWVANEGVVWTANGPHEIALCLSFCGSNGPRPRERGRLFLMPGLHSGTTITSARPNAAAMQWALDFYSVSNASLPDAGGVDWKFGVWSRTEQKFHQSAKAWVDDEWDTMRSRGLRPGNRIESVREG